MVVEPIAGEGGFVVPEPGWLPGLAEWCRANGVVLVADEIQSGFGRTGAWFACEHGVVPDIVTTAKSLRGLPSSPAITGRAELMDSVHPGGPSGALSAATPWLRAAALAAIDTIERDHGLLEQASGASGR